MIRLVLGFVAAGGLMVGWTLYCLALLHARGKD